MRNKSHLEKPITKTLIEALGVSHASLSDLTADDHTQYLKETDVKLNGPLSPMILSGGLISAGTNAGTFKVGALTALLRSTDDELGVLEYVTKAEEDNIVITDADISYRVILSYSEGTPTISISESLPNLTQNIPIGFVMKDGSDNVHYASSGHHLYDGVSKLHRRAKALRRHELTSGSAIAYSGTNNFTMTEGTAYGGINKFTLNAYNSASTQFTPVYGDGNSGFTEGAARNTIDFAHYDNGDGTLGEIGVGRYGCHWVYKHIYEHHVYVVYGTGSYKLAEAEVALEPTKPDHLTDFGLLIGCIIAPQAGGSFTTVQMVTDTFFTGTAVADHGALAGLGEDDHPQYQAINTAILKTHFNAKGDILSASDDDTPVILTVGDDDKVLSADSNEASGLKWIDPPAGGDALPSQTGKSGKVLVSDGSDAYWENFQTFKNRIINGDFDYWFRATSFISSGYGSADRWRSLWGGAGMGNTHSRQTFTPGQTDVPDNPVYYSRNVVTHAAGASNYALMMQRVENVNQFSGREVTLSFWAKANTSLNMSTEFAENFGTSGSAKVTAIGVEKHALTTSWQKFIKTVTITSISGKTVDNSDCCLELLFWFAADAAYDARTDTLGLQSGTFEISHVQLEYSAKATDFELRLPSTELRLCERYFWRSFEGGIGTGVGISSLEIRATVYHPSRMRSDPSIAGTVNMRCNVNNDHRIKYNDSDSQNDYVTVLIFDTPTGFVPAASTPYHMDMDYTGEQKLEFDAEL